MGVIQGKNYKELFECFDYMNPRCDLVAIPFSSKAYTNRFYNNSEHEAKAIGRVKLIRSLIKNGNVRKNSLHLIGMKLPIELELYTKEEKEYIYSLDTANPVQFGMEEYEYPEDLEEVKTKPKFMFTEENLKTEPTLTLFNNKKKY
jgi:predicted transcriptional regulator